MGGCLLRRPPFFISMANKPAHFDKYRSLVTNAKRLLRDMDNSVFKDEDYETIAWNLIDAVSTRPTVTAVLRTGTNQFIYPRVNGMLLWQVTFDQNSSEKYDVNEAARLIVNVGSADSRTEFTVTGDMLDFDQYMHDILMEIANSPAKSATYLTANGLTVDSRQAPAIIVEHARTKIGIR